MPSAPRFVSLDSLLDDFIETQTNKDEHVFEQCKSTESEICFCTDIGKYFTILPYFLVNLNGK